MSEFNTDASIMGQNAGTTAASLMQSLVNSGFKYESLDEFLQDFNDIRKDVYNGSISLAGADLLVEEFGEAPQRKSFGGGGNRGGNNRSGGSRPQRTATQVDARNPGATVVQFGKHRGKTLDDIYDEAPDYVEWLAENAQETSVKNAAAALVA